MPDGPAGRLRDLVDLSATDPVKNRRFVESVKRVGHGASERIRLVGLAIVLGANPSKLSSLPEEQTAIQPRAAVGRSSRGRLASVPPQPPSPLSSPTVEGSGRRPPRRPAVRET